MVDTSINLSTPSPINNITNLPVDNPQHHLVNGITNVPTGMFLCFVLLFIKILFQKPLSIAGVAITVSSLPAFRVRSAVALDLVLETHRAVTATA
jgi:hypothetical protein